MPDLYDATREVLLTTLQIPSAAGREADLAAWVREHLAGLGLSVETDDCHERIGGNCGNLLVRIPGTVDAPAIFFNSHLDTVEPTDGLTLVIDGDEVRTDGTTILGGDDKTGVAAILVGVAAALEAGLPRPPIEVLFTVQEETGLCGAKALDPAWLTARRGFVLDHGVPVGELVVSAPSQTSHEIVFRGRASHAGVAPEEGLNAIAVAAAAIGGVRQGRLDDETTCNIGVISGGRATNIVPDECRLQAEVRSRDAAKLEAQVAHLRAVCEQTAAEWGAGLEFGRTDVYEAFRIARDEPVAQIAEAAVRAAGLEPSWVEGGGGSDANIFCAAGLRCLIVSCGERDVHTHQEWCKVSDVAAAARLVYELVGAAAQAG